jgi:DnaJ-class molecular chaperone
MARNRRASRGRQVNGIPARWARRRSRAVVTIRARRRDLARLRAEHALDEAARGGPARCPQCGGSGQVASDRCAACSGKGWLSHL